MNELHLFAGAGGGILGSELLGIQTICAVELEPYPASVLLARQNDGLLPPFPIWDDVCTFDGRPWRGLVDVVSGGFPCQDISAAGKGAVNAGARSGLWREMHRIINEVRPKFAFLENSPLLVGRGLARVLGDLAEIGYDAESLAEKRRMDWNSNRFREEAEREVSGGEQAAQSTRICPDVSYSNRQLRRQGKQPGNREEIDNCGFTVSNTPHQGHVRGDGELSENERLGSQGDYHAGRAETNDCGEWWSAEPDVGRVAHGVAARVDRIKALGNGQVPAVAATAFRVLLGRIMKNNPQLTLF